MIYANVALQAGMGNLNAIGSMGLPGGMGVGGGPLNYTPAPAIANVSGFLAECDRWRLQRIMEARMLFEGRHREYFLDGRRTSWNFPADNINGRIEIMYLTFNILGLASLKSADLLFGQLPLFDCADEDQRQALDNLARRSMLHAVLSAAAVSASAEGEAFLEATIADFDGQVYIRQIPNEEIFPVGEVREDGQYGAYRRYRVKNVGTPKAPLWLLLQVDILPGLIQRSCWQLDKDGNKSQQIALTAWDPALAGQDSQQTGIESATVVWIPQLLGKARSDYASAIPHQDKFNADNTRVGRILQKHSNPKIGFPRRMADAQGNVPAASDAFFLDDMGQLPQYITWDANLDQALKDRAFTLNQLLVRLEMSPVLLGLKEGAAPDAYKKVRLEAFNSITAAGRRGVIWSACVQRMLDVAMALDNTRPGIAYPSGEDAPVGVTLRDGIPVDDSEQAGTLSTLRQAGLLSRKRGVKIIVGDAASTDAEVEQIEEEEEAAAPTAPLLPAALQTPPGANVNADDPQPGEPGAAVKPENA